MTYDNWKKINRKEKGMTAYGNEKKGGFVYISPLEKWDKFDEFDKTDKFYFSGTNGRGFIKRVYFKTRGKAFLHLIKYMEKHN